MGRLKREVVHVPWMNTYNKIIINVDLLEICTQLNTFVYDTKINASYNNRHPFKVIFSL